MYMKTKPKSVIVQNPDKRKQFDSQYIIAFLDNAQAGKLAALCKTDHPNPTRQKAWDLHRRLAARIDAELDLRICEGAAVGYAMTLKLAKGAESEAVQAQCSSKLMEYGDKSKPQRIQIETIESQADIDAEIAMLTERISQAVPDNDTETQH